ncbi:MAG: tetratricopeptide repeat protein [Burkholderiaceae bacterium]|nr:tetratricopeptide repeat protein [Burkholderiaceae bacterium]
MTHRFFSACRIGLAAIGLAFVCSNAHAQADDLTTRLSAEQQKWDRIQYEAPAADREAAFKALAVTAAELVQTHPGRAEAHTWLGIALASEGRANGGLGVLTVVRQARDAFEKARGIDPKVMGGAVYYGLGGLYANVPRWPIGFGDKERAETLFKEAIAVSPDGLDSNYYYADFLIAQKRPKEARPYLERALQAPLRAGRELADNGRRAKVRQMLREVPPNVAVKPAPR